MALDRSYQILPIEGMEAFQKNFAKLLKDGDSVAERYTQKGKISLTDRFHLIERGFYITLKENNRKTMFEDVKVRLVIPDESKKPEAKPKASKKDKKAHVVSEENKENIDSGRCSAQSN